MKKVLWSLLAVSCLSLTGCSNSTNEVTSSSNAESTNSKITESIANSFSSQSTMDTTQLTAETSQAELVNPNLDENGVLIKYPYTLEYNDATYKILSTKKSTGSLTNSSILTIEMEFTNKGTQPQSPYISFITNFDAQQTDGTTTSTLMGANGEMGNLEDQEAVKMGDSNVNSGQTVKAIIGYTLEYPDKQVTFINRVSQITGENNGFIIQ